MNAISQLADGTDVEGHLYSAPEANGATIQLESLWGQQTRAVIVGMGNWPQRLQRID